MPFDTPHVCEKCLMCCALYFGHVSMCVQISSQHSEEAKEILNSAPLNIIISIVVIIIIMP